MSTSNQEISSYIRIVTRRWWLLLLLPIVTVAVIMALSSSTEPEYVAYSRLQILPIESQEVPLFSRSGYTPSSEQIQAIHADFYDVLRMPSVAWKTIADLGLPMSATELIERIDSQHQTEFITVSARMPDPKLAQQVLTAQVQNALDAYRDIRSKPAEISLEFIQEQLDEESQVLAEKQEALQKFQLENEVSDLNREITAYQDLRRALQSDRDRAVVEAQRNEKLAEEYQALSETNFAQAEALMASMAISETTTPEEEGEAGETPKKETPEEEPEPDPVMVAEADNLFALARSQRGIAEEHTATAQGHRAAAAEFGRLLDERQQELIYLLGLQEDYEGLVADVAQAQATHAFLTDKANEAQLKLSQGQNVGYLQVIEPARLPNAALPKRTMQLLLVGSIVSLLIAILFAFVLEAIETSLGRSDVPSPPSAPRT